MEYTKLSCEEFIAQLSSKQPVPGGGGASALVGAVGVALGNMVGSLTTGKKKYADVQQDIENLQKRATALQNQLLELVQQDAVAFEPLSKAYGMPKDTEEQQAEKQKVMENALQTASDVPLAIMQKCCEAIEMHEEFAQKGSAIAISDVGVGVSCCRAALLGASLNVFINTKAMQNAETARQYNRKANAMLDEYTKRADDLFASVAKRFALP